MVSSLATPRVDCLMGPPAAPAAAPAAPAADDPVIAEYDVYLTPPLAEDVYLVQYPNRARNRGYNSRCGATPDAVRIKPKSGFLEMDIKLSTDHNFNKYMGLKWGDATATARQLHNKSATYGPAAGLVPAKARGLAGHHSLKDSAARELQLEHGLGAFRDAEQLRQVHDVQTLAGQILRHDADREAGKPHYFVGAFQGGQLHLTNITATVQMRPAFHHLDAEDERARIASSRAAHADALPHPSAAAIPQSVKQKELTDQDKQGVEYRLRKNLELAAIERWIPMEYVDDESDRAYSAFDDKLKLQHVATASHLRTTLDDDAYLDAISAPTHHSPTRRRRRPARRTETVELDEEEHVARA